jgi:aspartyl-tRNA(Asn)/glutamyl-tRNA(Gln) amidotransferase subunit A
MKQIIRRSLLGISSFAVASAHGEPHSLTWLTIEDAGRLMRKGAISPLELTHLCLERIERLNPAINAFITVPRELALAQANAAERDLRRGNWRGPLHGIPIALKDNIDTAGVRTTAASALYAERMPPEDSEVVRRLVAGGAIIIGKTNLDEFAFGRSGRLSHFGPAHNPWSLDSITGGSSGGSAAALAAGLCFGALGTDTSSSVRLPAAYCGIVGLRPSPGLVSTRGVLPASRTLDEVGSMCRTVRDCSLLFGVISGGVATRVNRPKLHRIGIPRPFYDGLHPEISRAVDNALDVLKHVGWRLHDVDLPGLNTTNALAMGRIPLSGVWSAVAAPEAIAFHQPLTEKSPQLYGREVYSRIADGSKITKDTYAQAQKELANLRHAVGAIFTTVDVLVTPTTPIPACSIDTEPPLDAMRNTMPLSVYGLPTISIPCGFTSADLPIGLQITGPHRGEHVIFTAAEAYERVTDWHTRHPKIATA